ncbi:MAG TPA: hypothetical protein VKA27_00600 [Sunxiuqinia sp.]|nr:hypothetical protein [Sunxiuqinia sp.]
MEKSESAALKKLQEEIQSINERLAQVESSIDQLMGTKVLTREIRQEQQDEYFEFGPSLKSKRSLEYSVGEYGMAWLGNIVLLFGIAFLVQYLQQSGSILIGTVIGFLAIAVIYGVSYFSRNTFAYLSKLFSYNGHLLLFYLTLRLHFLEAEPIIKSKSVGLVLLVLVLATLFYLAWHRKSKIMAGLVSLMMLITGVVANSLAFQASITTISAMLVMALYYKNGWVKLVFTMIFLVYLSHLTWLVNNPIMGNSLGLPQPPGINYLNLIVTGILFSLLAIIPKPESVSKEFLITAIIWNGIIFTGLLALSTVLFYTENYVLLYSSIAVFCLIYSVILQSRADNKLFASMYALYGFLGMSVAFYGIFLLPKAYALFAIQSLLVVSMALWFRSRFIVVMNTILFIVLMLFYMMDTLDSNATNFSFMLVAFLTARVINWKKERLKIKTEFMRNLYLLAGFSMTLIAFYHAVPNGYITASWIFAAILFFLTSLLLKNVKYRWLAIASMVASAIKLIFVDMSNIDIGYRVLLFLGLAVISITASILYTKFYKQKKGTETD